MNERGSGFGPFMLGVAVGAVLGFLFAPEPGDETRRKLTKKFRRLRSLAEEQAAELMGGARELIEGEAEEGSALSAREELEERLAEARRRRRRVRGGEGTGTSRAEDDAVEDEPVA